MNTLISGDSSAPTLGQVWIDYQVTRDLKATTVKNYSQRLRVYLGDWLDLPIDLITKHMVEERHRSIKGNATANSTFRTLRALLHYAAVKYEDAEGVPVIKNNPVRRLSELRAWHRDRRRKTIIPLTQIGIFFKAIWTIENHTARDYLLTLLFTGLRSHEAAALRWEQVDLGNGTLTVLEGMSKNGEELLIPLSSYLWDVLKVRNLSSTSEWVFPGKSQSRHLTCLNKSYRTVMQRSGIKFCLHDIRRTYVSIGDELDIKAGVLKQLVNHKRDDITESYTFRSTERLRRATQLITNAILGELRK